MFDKLHADVLFMRGEYEKAAELYHEGARDGNIDAAFNYAHCLLYGIGCTADAREAKSYFVFARDMASGEACYNLAVMYIDGLGVAKNYQRALDYMHTSAELGCVEAQLYLGMAYTTGCVFVPDIMGIDMIPYHKPIYRQTSVPLLYGEAEDAERDEDLRFGAIRTDAREAFLWFRRAAHADPTYVAELVAQGQYLYAKCHLDGFGTDPDLNKGTRLMLVAGKSGSQDAVIYLKENGVDPAAYISAPRTKRGRK